MSAKSTLTSASRPLAEQLHLPLTTRSATAGERKRDSSARVTASLSIFRASSEFSRAMAAWEEMPERDLEVLLAEGVGPLPGVEEEHALQLALGQQRHRAMALRMPWATMLSLPLNRLSRMASAVSTAWRVSSTRFSTVSDSTTSSSLLSGGAPPRPPALRWSRPRKMTPWSAARSWKLTLRILSRRLFCSRSSPTWRWNSWAMRSFS